MAENLRLRKVADLVTGVNGHKQPAWYEVDGLPNGQEALIEFTGNSNKRWRINRISSVGQSVGQDDLPTFETPEEALIALRKELE
jgi:hypothetical protein